MKMQRMRGILKISLLMGGILLSSCGTNTNDNRGVKDSTGNTSGSNTLGTISGDSAGIVNTRPTNDTNVLLSDTGKNNKIIPK